MRAVTGTVTSSKPISLSKASAFLSRFAAGIGARRDIAAYLKRASTAFEDLVQVHRELRSSRKRGEQGVGDGGGEDTSRRKKKKEKDGDPNPSENLQSKVKLEVLEEEKDGDPNPSEKLQSKVKLEVLEEEEEEEAEERRNKKRKKKKKEREDGSLEVYGKGDLMEVEGNIEKRMDLEKNYTELIGKVMVEAEEVEGDRSAERRKRKKEKEEKKRDREVVENGGGEAEDGSERREKTKKRRKTGMEE